MTTEETIDTIDRKILEFLQKDARTSLNVMARECQLSSSAILTRIKKLKQNGVIVGNSLFVENKALGYPFEATIGIIAQAPKFNQIAEEIRSQPSVKVCTKSIGRYNMLSLVLARNMEDLDRVTQKIKNVDGVKAIAVNIILEHTLRMQKGVPLKLNENNGLDDVDLAIIDELMIDSSLSFNSIAKKVKVSHETVRKKFERLKEKGVIIGCHAIIDQSKLGYQGTAFIFIRQTQEGNKTSILGDLKEVQQLFMVNSVMGAFDIVAFSLFKNLRDFTKLIDEIQKIPGVGQIEISLANFTYFAYKPMPKTPIKCDTLELS